MSYSIYGLCPNRNQLGGYGFGIHLHLDWKEMVGLLLKCFEPKEDRPQ